MEEGGRREGQNFQQLKKLQRLEEEEDCVGFPSCSPGNAVSRGKLF